jgi:hypothetical protein
MNNIREYSGKLRAHRSKKYMPKPIRTEHAGPYTLQTFLDEVPVSPLDSWAANNGGAGLYREGPLSEMLLYVEGADPKRNIARVPKEAGLYPLTYRNVSDPNLPCHVFIMTGVFGPSLSYPVEYIVEQFNDKGWNTQPGLAADKDFEYGALIGETDDAFLFDIVAIRHNIPELAEFSIAWVAPERLVTLRPNRSYPGYHNEIDIEVQVEVNRLDAFLRGETYQYVITDSGGHVEVDSRGHSTADEALTTGEDCLVACAENMRGRAAEYIFDYGRPLTELDDRIRKYRELVAEQPYYTEDPVGFSKGDLERKILDIRGRQRKTSRSRTATGEFAKLTRKRRGTTGACGS